MENYEIYLEDKNIKCIISLHFLQVDDARRLTYWGKTSLNSSRAKVILRYHPRREQQQQQQQQQFHKVV